MIATRMAATPAHCRMISRIERSSIQLCMALRPGLAAVNTVVYGAMSRARNHGRSTFGTGLGKPGPEDAGEKRFYGAEGGTAGQGDGGVARQFLLAFRRYFRVPRRDPEALARDRG